MTTWPQALLKYGLSHPATACRSRRPRGPSGWPRTRPPATGRGSAPTRRRSSSASPADAVPSTYHCELAWLGGDRADGRRASSTSTATASPASTPASPAPPPARVRLAGLTAARVRQRPQPRLPPRPARPHARRARARSGRGASRCTSVAADARSRRVPPRWPGRRTARWRWPAITRRRRVPLPPPRSRRRAVRVAQRDGRRAGRRRRARPASGSRCSTPATCAAGSGVDARRRAAAVLRRRRRRRGRPGSTGCADGPGVRIGAAVHSVRAVDPASIATVAAWADGRGRAAARPRVRAAGRERAGARRPRRARRSACSPTPGALERALHRRPRHPPHAGRHRPARRGAVLVLHLPDDRARPRRRHRADGRAARRRAPGSTLGSDSHAVIDLLEEARAVELDERLASRRRGRHDVAGAAADGHGRRPRQPRLAGRRPHRGRRARRPDDDRASTRSARPAHGADDALGTARVRGDRRRRPPRRRRRPGRRARRPPHVDRRRRRAAGGCWRDDASSSTASGGSSPTPRAGELPDAHVVIDGDRVVAVGTGPAPAADERIDAGGRCVIPGFVDSHTHLVFAGDRAGRVRRPHGRRAVRGRRHQHDDRRHPRRVRRRAARRSPRPGCAEARRAGITTIEIKSGYGATVDDEARLVRLAAELTPETTFLGAHVVPAGVDADDYVELVCGDDARRRRAARPVDRRVLRARRVRRRPVPRTCSTAGRDAGLGLRLHANQLGPGPGVQLAVELGCASADHCTYLDRRRRRRARRQRHRGHVPPGDGLLDPPAVPRRPPGDRRRRDGRPGHQLQPGVELHDVDVVRHRPRRARPADDGDRGAHGGDARRRPGAAPRRRRLARPRLTCRPRRARRPELRPPRLPPRRPADPPHDRPVAPDPRVSCASAGQHDPRVAANPRVSGARGRGRCRSRRKPGRSPNTARAWRSGTRSRDSRRSRVASGGHVAGLLELGPQALVLGLQLHHPPDALEVHARLGELGDAPQHLDVGVAVAAVAALRAGRHARARDARRCAASGGACRPARRRPR